MKRWSLRTVLCRFGFHDPVPELIGFPWITCHRCGTPV